MSENRRTWLDKLLGREESTNLRTSLQQMASTLDGAGVARKEAPPIEEEAPPAAEQVEPEETDTPQADMLEKLSRKMAQDLMTSLKDDWASMTEDKLAAALLSSMGLPPTEEVPQEPPPEEDEEMQHMTDTDTPTSEERKAFTDSLAAMVKDMSTIAADFRALVTQQAQKDAATQQREKTLADSLSALAQEVGQIKQQMAGRPRTATQAAETTLDPTSEAARAVESAIKKGVGETKTILGIPVKE